MRRNSLDRGGERRGDELLEGRSKTVQTPVEGLIAGQMREPCPPVTAHIFVDAALLIEALHVAEQVDG